VSREWRRYLLALGPNHAQRLRQALAAHPEPGGPRGEL
jgi:hypothetical protein